MSPPVFEAKSTDKASLLHISFASDPKGSLGTKLSNCDKGDDSEMFLPGYAIVDKILDGETVAKKAGVATGDVIIAVNGECFRRFEPDDNDKDAPSLSEDVDVTLDNAVIESGKGYDNLLSKIKEIKGCGGDPALILSLLRFGWDARPNSWKRFLTARDGNVAEAMQMIQAHESWKALYFPIQLQTPGLQKILRQKAVSEIDIHYADEATITHPPTVYVNYGVLSTMIRSGEITSADVVQAFVIFTERMLAKSKDPRNPKTCQFIDVSGASITSGLRVDALKEIYKVFEPNYPETLFKMVLYPVNRIVAMTTGKLLSFVNENTRKKFLITNNLQEVCEELGWDQAEVEECGGITDFMHRHEKAGNSMIYD